MTTLPNPISTPTTERLKLNYTLRADGVAAGSSRRRTKACCSKRLARTHALLRTAAMASVSAIASAIAIHNEATNDELKGLGLWEVAISIVHTRTHKVSCIIPGWCLCLEELSDQ